MKPNRIARTKHRLNMFGKCFKQSITNKTKPWPAFVLACAWFTCNLGGITVLGDNGKVRTSYSTTLRN